MITTTVRNVLLEVLVSAVMISATDVTPNAAETTLPEKIHTTTNQKELSPQTTCPVMGGTIKKKYFVEQNGKRIYTCCAGCCDAVNVGFNHYLRKLAVMGQVVESVEYAESVTIKK